MYKRQEYVPLNEIAIRQEISEKYLEIVLKILVKKKLLKGRRGKGGGYQLTREPSEYTIGEILRPSVSYTHLDVYKRQVIFHLPAICPLIHLRSQISSALYTILFDLL